MPVNGWADPDPARELVEALDAAGAVIGTTTRAEMRARNIWHRSTMVVVLRGKAPDRIRSLDPATPIVVHRRADWKDVFPGYWDLCFGGVCDVGESWSQAAGRELAEEAGLGTDGQDLVLVDRGRFIYDGEHSRAHIALFLAWTNLPVIPTDGEVVEVAEVALGELETWMGTLPVCPDSAAVAGAELVRLLA